MAVAAPRALQGAEARGAERGARGGLGSIVAFALRGALVVWSLAPAAWQPHGAQARRADHERPHGIPPSPPTLEHFGALWQRKPFGAYLANSLCISVAATLLWSSLARPPRPRWAG